MSFPDNLHGQRVLVTGGTGFIGRAVVAEGLAHHAEVHVVTRQPANYPPVTLWPGDLNDAQKVAEIVTAVRPQGILHLAAGGVVYGSGNLSGLLRVNVLGLEAVLLAAAKLSPPPTVVIAGSGFEYAPKNRPLCESDPLGPTGIYGVSKVAATMLAGTYAAKMPVTVLRLFSLYGGGESEPRLAPSVIGQTLRGQPVELTPGDQVRDYVSVRDAATAFWRALAKPQSNGHLRVLNIGSGIPMPLRQFVEAIAAVLREHGLKPDLRFGARSHRPDEMMCYTADILLLKETLSWYPQTELRKGLSEMVLELLGRLR